MSTRTQSGSFMWIVFVSPVEFPQMTPRLTREFQAVEQSSRYRALVISTETRRKDLPGKMLENRVLSANVLKAYSPAFVPLNEYKRGFAKPFVALFYVASQFIYILQVALLLFHAIGSYHPKLIHVHNAPDMAALATMLVSKLSRLPYIFEMHDFAPEIIGSHMGISRQSIIYIVLKLIEKQILENASAVIAVNQMMTLKIECPPEKKIVIYSGWSSKVRASETKEDTRQRYHLAGKFVILYHGYFEPETRALKPPIDAVGKLKNDKEDIVLVYLGFGTYYQELQQYVEQKGLGENVIFLPAVQLKEMFNIIQMADVAFVPNRNVDAIRWTVGNKLLEYMAMGKPLVASNTPGNREVVRNMDNGILYDPESAEEFVNAIELLYTNPALREQLGKRARKDFVDNYCSEINMERLFRLYDRVIREKG